MNPSAATLIALHLMNGNTIDYKAIALALFNDDPDTFLKYSKIEKSGPLWMHEVIHQLKHDQIIEAIKTIRANTGWGLKESKDVLDRVRGLTYNAILGAHQLDLVHKLKAML